jgi:hypothetical protein
MATKNTHVDLDLDSIQRPQDQIQPEFAFTWKGRRIVLGDPAELDFRELLEITHPLGFLKHTASQEDRDFLASDEGSMEGWRMGELIERYYKHFKLGDKIEDAKQRERLGF